MKLLKKELPLNKIEDDVFGVVKRAKADILKHGIDNVTNATIGTLYDENGDLVVYDTIFNTYKLIDNKIHGSYATGIIGDVDYLNSIENFLFENIDFNLNYKSVGTIGGTGAISMTLLNHCSSEDMILAPSIAWGSYKTMAEQFGLKYETYNLFKDDKFDLEDLKNKCRLSAELQNKIVLIINDPCHNPTGLSLGSELWNEIITFLNSFDSSMPIILLNDIAYIDYSYDLENSRKYMEQFNNANSNILVNIAFSCSKVFSFYGVRLGALISCNKDLENVENVFNANERACRALVSNVSNGGMKTITDVLTNHKAIYLNEKKHFIKLLKDRSTLFVEQANECGLEFYPYNEGFFITLKVEDNNRRNIIHEVLMDNHIYTVKVNQGIRIAVCSLSCRFINGLALKIKNIIDTIK